MDEVDAMRAIRAHATDGRKKYGPILGYNGALKRIQASLDKATDAAMEETDTSASTETTRRIAQIAGTCYNWLTASAASYTDVALTIEPTPSTPPADEMQNPATTSP